MKFNSMAVLRETLEQMETQRLDAMLHEELKKEQPDGQLVRLIGCVLQDRERDNVPQISPNARDAWERYQQRIQPVHKEPRSRSRRLVKAASWILVLLTLAALIPQKASAMNFFQRFIAWTEDVFSLVSPAETRAPETAYAFRTDNPGLQEVYDQVTALGVTVPVVPMWLPEGYELTECETLTGPQKSAVSASFFNGMTKAVFQLDVYSGNITSAYSKDANSIHSIEKNGIEHTLICNKDYFIIVWTVENVECSIFIDCQENVLNRILESIYTVEEN